MAKRGRPKNPEVAYDVEAVKDFISRLFTIESEINVLREDKKTLKDEFKGKVDSGLIGKIVRLVKLKVDLSTGKASPDTIEEIEGLVLDKVNKVLP